VNDITATWRGEISHQRRRGRPETGRGRGTVRRAEDLEAKTIRAVGDAKERFSEDGLPYCAPLGSPRPRVRSRPATHAAIEPTLDTYKKVSASAVRDEWVKTMKAKKPSRASTSWRETGILGVSCPRCSRASHGAEQWHGSTSGALDGVHGCVRRRSDPAHRALLHDVGKPRTRAFSDKTQDWTFYDHDRVGAEIAFPITTRLKF